MASALTLAVANPNPVHLRQVMDEFGVLVSTLSPVATIYDVAGAPVANAVGFLLPPIAGAPGEYRGSLPANAALVIDRNYSMQITAANLHLVLPCRAKEWGSF